MVDLAGQHLKIQHELNEAIAEVIKTSAFIKGPQVKTFEDALASYLQVKHVIGCANGTDALQLALMALNLPAGAEVITSNFTFVATAEVIALLGFTPVLVDVNPQTFLIDTEKLRNAITSKTKAIIPVHLFGQCANMAEIMQIAEENNLFVIEDNAQALGAYYFDKKNERKKAGTIGHIGCTSFFPSKNLGCMGDGGALFTNDDELAERIKSMANHGQGKQYFYDYIGINSRLDTLQASVLNVKLKYLDQYNNQRKVSASSYTNELSGIENLQTPELVEHSTHIFHQYTLKVLDGRRDELIQFLAEQKIPAKVYYPVPLHAHKPYHKNSRFDIGNLQNSIKLSEQVLSLPMHTELNGDQINYITKTIKAFFA